MELFNNKMDLLKNIAIYEEKCIESSLGYPYRALNLYIKDSDIEEGYIKDDQLYYIDTIIKYKDCNKIQCLLDLSEIEAIYFEKFESGYRTVDEIFASLLSKTNWIFKGIDSIKKRNISIYNSNGIEIIEKICERFNINVEFNNIEKSIKVINEKFTDESIKQNTVIKKNKDKRKIVTRIIPKANNIDIKPINNNLNYIDDNSYSSKIYTVVWYDNSYTNAQDLLEDAKYKLSQVCKTKKTYVFKGKLHIGDSFLYRKEKFYVIQEFSYEKYKEKNIYIATNSKINIETSGDKIKEILDIINIKGLTLNDLVTLDNSINNSMINSIDVDKINGLDKKVLEITKVVELRQNTNELKQKIEDVKNNFKITNGEIDNLKSKTAQIDARLNGNLNSENIQAGGITSDKLTISDGFIKKAMIDSVSANQVDTGVLNTDNVEIKSKDGNLLIKDNTIQIKDSTKVRVQIGKDKTGDYNMYVFDDKGNLMFDATGVKADGIKDKIIRNDMVSDDAAIEGKKLNIESVIREVNNGKSNLKASKIDIDTKGQALDIAFSNLVTESGKNKEEIVSLITKLNVQQGQINSSIENSKVLEGKQKNLEDNYNRTVVTVDSLKNTIGSHKTLIDSATRKITSVENKANTLEKDLNSISQSIVDTKEIIENNKKNSDDKNSSLKQDIDNVNVNVQKISKETEKIETSINNTNQEIQTLNSRSSALEINLKSINQKISESETKAQIIETKLNGKAEKQEINNVNNKIAKVELGLNGITQKVETSEIKICQVDGKVNSMATKDEIAQLELTTKNIGLEISKKVDGDELISKINLSPEALKIDANKIELNGYVTFTSLQNSGGTIINADNIQTGTIKSVNIESCYFRGKNTVYIEEGGVFSCDGDGYIKYIRCDEAWMTSPYSTGWKVPLIHSKFGVKDNQSSLDMVNEIAFYSGTDKRNYLQITNTKTGRVEYVELYTANNDTKTIINEINDIKKEIQILKNK